MQEEKEGRNQRVEPFIYPRNNQKESQTDAYSCQKAVEALIATVENTPRWRQALQQFCELQGVPRGVGNQKAGRENKREDGEPANG